MPRKTISCPVIGVTNGPLHHFFGYYDKTPWDDSGRYLLAGENSFMDRNPTLDDPLTLGVIDLDDNNTFVPVTRTRAWNWQQGCMLRWSEWDAGAPVFFFSDWRDGHYVTVRYHLEKGEEAVYPWPIYDIADHGRLGATLNFERITDTRPGYGYFGPSDPFGDQLAPDEDGIYIIDMDNQMRKLAFSLADALKYGEVRPPSTNKTWFNHIEWNPRGTRFSFLHRWSPEAVPGHHGFKTRLFAIDADGSNPVCLVEGIGVSHYDWLDDNTILVWLWDIPQRPDTDHYYLIDVPSGKRKALGEDLFEYDGHCSFSPDGKWILTDTYPKGECAEQTLILWNYAANMRIDVGRFPALPVANDSWRCDLHPRWNRDSTQICIDSTHEGSRQMYIVDVSTVTDR